MQKYFRLTIFSFSLTAQAMLGALDTATDSYHEAEAYHEFDDCHFSCDHQCPVVWSARLLYLKPNIDDTHYVLSSFDNTFEGSLYPSGKRHQNTASFKPGFTVEGLYPLSPVDSYLGASFTYFTAHARASTSGGFLYDTNGYPGFGAQDSPVYSGTATSHNRYNAYFGDLNYQRAFSCLFPDNFTFVFGLQSAYVQFKEHTTSFGTFTGDDGVQALRNNMKRGSQFFGLGPEIGLNYRYLFPSSNCVPGAFGLNARARSSLLCGRVKSDLHYVTLRTGPGGVNVSNKDNWRVIPAATAEVGADYAFACEHFNALFEMGYTFTWFGKCVNKITGLDTAFAGDSVDMFNDLSLHGPYIRISTTF